VLLFIFAHNQKPMKTMFKKFLPALLFLVLPFAMFAQGQLQPFNYSNADDILLHKKIAEDPTLYSRYLIYENNLKQIIESGKTQKDQKTDTLINGKRIIPVVFHIIHKGGPENISKAQVEDAIALLNIDYNKLNSDTDATHTWPAFTSRRADCQIEFRLARIDPDGNCTDGIVRHYDSQTNYAYFTTMSQYAWSPSRYLNIFSVAFIYPEGITLPDGAFIGGMSPFPPSNTLSQALTGGDTLADGILIRHDGIGSIGTATTLGGMPINALNRTLTHESGHYFNLYHPFQNLMFGLIPSTDGCPSLFAPNGDEVDDTPPVQTASQNTSTSCYPPGSRNTCNQDSPDEPDMVENYMDYQWGYCTNIFTNGQYARVDATLNGDRRKLWSIENLLATGVLDTLPQQCPPRVDFYANKFFVCAGESVTFTDYSFNGTPDTWAWTFTGGSPSTSSIQNPTIIYNTAGVYDAKLIVTNINGSDSLIKSAYIYVSDPTTSDTTPVVEDFEISNLNEWTIINDVGNTWELSTAAAFSGSKCLAINNFSGNTAGSYDEIISPMYDLTTLPSGILPIVKFKLGYAGKYVAGTIVTAADTVYDKLSMYVSKDCGGTWVLKYNKSGIDLTSVTTVPDDFIPVSASDWSQESAALPINYLSETGVRIKFVFYSNGGNNLYIDDINIVSATAGIGEINLSQLNLTVTPNPFSESTRINFSLSSNCYVSADIYDLIGQRVLKLTDENLNAGNHEYNISRSQLGSSGIYFVKMIVDGQTITKKLIVQ
jgi:PKD repeat protein